MFADRVLSGMRPTGRMHIGHYHGALKNWVRLQEEYECLYFAADWHALTTHYDDAGEHRGDRRGRCSSTGSPPGSIPRARRCSSSRACLEHAELTLLLGMMTPVGWLERVPTYKDQQQKLADRDLSTYGFLGYPVMQGADILIYRANMVPVGEDQVSHVELVRELARRFNHIYGREPGFEEKAKAASRSSAPRRRSATTSCARRSRRRATTQALEAARELLNDTQNLSLGDRERLFGYLEGSRRVILPEPRGAADRQRRRCRASTARRCRSRTATRSSCARIRRRSPKKIRTMQTDPARVRRTDPGNPENCPVWPLHQIYSTEDTREWVVKGCTTAGIGCLECKQPVIDAIIKEQEPIIERAQKYLDDPTLVRNIVADGCERARKLAEETMRDVREAMGLSL